MSTSAAEPKIIGKQRLDIPMYINRIEGGLAHMFNEVCWIIIRFSRLKDNVRYVMPPDVQVNWVLSLMKTKKNLEIHLHPFENDKPIVCFIKYDVSMVSRPYYADDKGRLDYTIPLKDIQVPENRFFKKDNLLLDFRFNKNKEKTFLIRPAFNTDKHLTKFQQQLINFKENRFEPDFLLNIEEKGFFVWKAVLAARCRFFYNYLKENEDLSGCELSATPVALDQMANFLYYGTMTKPRTLTDMISLLLLSASLDFPSLRSSCEVMLKSIITTENANIIRKAGINSGVQSIVKAVDEFLAET